MEVSCSEGVANRTGPRVMSVPPQGGVGSVDRGRYGLGIEPRKVLCPECRRCSLKRKATSYALVTRGVCGLRVVVDPMHVSKHPARNSGGPVVGLAPCARSAWPKKNESTATMNDSGKSDKPIVPKKGANKGRGGPRPAERLEGRGLAKGNPGEQTRFWTQGQVDLPHALERIRTAARRLKNVITRGRSPVR